MIADQAPSRLRRGPAMSRRARQGGSDVCQSVVLGLMILLSNESVACAQLINAAPAPPTFMHEVWLLVIGAVVGGLLAPVLASGLACLGVDPGGKERREIASHLKTLVEIKKAERPQSQKATSWTKWRR